MLSFFTLDRFYFIFSSPSLHAFFPLSFAVERFALEFYNSLLSLDGYSFMLSFFKPLLVHCFLSFAVERLPLEFYNSPQLSGRPSEVVVHAPGQFVLELSGAHRRTVFKY